MREIKFRAWNKNTKQMIDLKAITPLALDISANGIFLPFRDDLILMQYTGLKDKNGQEIYEGDIVKHLTYGGNYPVTYSCENTGYGLKTRRGSMHLCSDCCPNLEVIGNIYENKELLDGKS